MATCNVVNVLCTNGRRQKVKVSPQMTLLQVIQEVCKKQNFGSNNYGIRHQRKTLDRTLTVRFANLPNNAHLELIELAEGQIHTVQKCVVALQLENGERLVHEFKSDTSLLEILEHWKNQSERISFEDNSLKIACIYANQEIKGTEKLKTTTLSMVGLNGGRGVIRFVQPSQKCEKDGSEVMEGVYERPNNEAPKATPSTATPDSVPVKSSTEEMDIESRTASSVSMASQTSDDFTMQCAEPSNSDQQPPATLDSSATGMANKDDIIMQCAEPSTNHQTQQQPLAATLDTSTTSTPNTSNAVTPKSKKAEYKSKDVSMDVEPLESAGVPQVNKAGVMKDCEVLPPKNTTSSSQSAATVQVFGGVGRTLSTSGPDAAKKPRLHSPPDAPRATTVKQTKSELTIPGENVDRKPREAVAFRLGDGNLSSTDDNVSDEFFEVTVDDLRLMLKDLKSERKSEAQLSTKTMRENSDKSKMEKYGKVAIRVYFPDRYVLQGFFSPEEKVQEVYNFVRESLHHGNKSFYLYTTPPRTMLNKPDLSLFEAKLFPAAVVYFGSHEIQDEDFYLSKSLLEETIDLTRANEKVNIVSRPASSLATKATDIPQATQKIATDNNILSTTSANDKDSKQNSETGGSSQNQTQRTTSNSNSTGKPKWFKMGK